MIDSGYDVEDSHDPEAGGFGRHNGKIGRMEFQKVCHPEFMKDLP